MNKSGPLGAAMSLLVALTLSGPVPAVASGATQPARSTVRAPHAVLIGVTSAGKRLVAVGERGIIVLSDDNGRTWRQASVPAGVTLTAVRFVSEQLGWAVGHGGVVLQSRDGGASWQSQLDAARAAALMVDAAKRRQQEGGGTEAQLARELADAQRMAQEGPDKPFLDLYFSDAQNGFIVGAYNLLFRTTDGGRSWEPWQSHIDNPQGLHLYAIAGSGADLYIVGEQGSVFRSADGGQRFSRVDTPYKGSYFGLVAGPGPELVAFGLRGSVYRSADRGANWTQLAPASQASVAGGTRLKDGRLVLVNQAGQVLLGEAGGLRTLQGRPLAPLAGVVQADNGDVVVVGMRGAERVALATVSGGAR
jgi:photosystem II stability/assembly factor-like uncharacterized protein